MMSSQVPTQNDEEPVFSKKIGLGCVLLLLLSFSLYARGLNYPLVRDDLVILRAHPALSESGEWAKAWTEGYWPEASEKDDLLYRPLPLLSYAVQIGIHGVSPAWLRAVNVLLHGIVCVVVFLFVRGLLGDPRVGFFAGLLFCVHGLNVEAVQMVIGRSDLLAALFFCLGLIFHRSSGEVRWSRKPLRRLVEVLAGLSFFAALLSKESAVTFLAAAAGLEVWGRIQGRGERPGRGGSPGRGSLGIWIGYGLAFGAYLGIRSAVFGGSLSRGGGEVSVLDNPFAGESFGVRLLGGFTLVAKSLRLFLWPHPVSTDYSLNAVPIPEGWGEGMVWLGVCASGALIAAGFVLRRRSAGVLVGSIWFAVTWSLASNVVLAIGTVFGLRLLYLPGVGLSLVGASLLVLGVDATGLGARRRLLLGSGVVGALAAVWGGLAFAQIEMYQDEETLILSSLEAAPQSARLQYLAGGFLARRGEEQRARSCLSRSLEIFPDNDSARAIFGMLLVRGGEIDRGLEEIETVRRRAPGIVLPSFLHLGRSLIESNRSEEAIRYLELYSGWRPGDQEARRLLHQARSEVRSPR